MSATAAAGRGGGRAAAAAIGPAGIAIRLAVAPAAVVVLVALVVLGPPLGDLLAPASPPRFLPSAVALVHPEPLEHARYLIALSAPFALAAAAMWIGRRPELVRRAAAARAAAAVELAAAAALVVCFALQRTATVSSYHSSRVVYFTLPTLLAGAALAAAALLAARRRATVRRLARWSAESPSRLLLATLLACVATALTALPAIVTDASIGASSAEFTYHVIFTYDETLAVLDGRSPLGDFAAQYGALWPYAVALAVAPFGASLAAFTVSMAALFGVAMLALFGLLRRVTRSAPAALALFLPLLATSAFRLHDGSVARFSLVNYFGTMPLRYAGPFLVAWLVARHLDGARPHRAWPLFLAGGLAAANNVDFGLPALAAVAAALLWAGPRSGARLRALALEASLGLGAAGAAVTLLLLVRTGAPPDPALAVRYARVFAAGGFGMEPIRPLLGLGMVVYLTYAAALAGATVRAFEGRERVLTGMLAWSGVFGLGAGGYYVGRSIPEALTNMFPAWGLALALLAVLAWRALVARGGRRPRPLEVAWFVGVGLLACSLAQTPSPVAQARRIAHGGAHWFAPPLAEPFVDAHTRAGEPVAVLTELGHGIAYRLGLDDLAPYTGAASILTEEQLDDTLAALREAGGRSVFLDAEHVDVAAALQRRGFRLAARDPRILVDLWTAP
ncbi:MAG TPA: hypothetical protein VF250_15130 [Conexibacter sp.]